MTTRLRLWPERAQDLGDRLAGAQGHLRGDREFVGPAADAVGAEKLHVGRRFGGFGAKGKPRVWQEAGAGMERNRNRRQRRWTDWIQFQSSVKGAEVAEEGAKDSGPGDQSISGNLGFLRSLATLCDLRASAVR